MLDSLPLSGGPHQFFAATSFSTALSSMASASSRLSRAFSSSSTFSLRACDTSMPPYLAFHAYSVALLMPCLRHTSAVFIPPSCSRSTAMICSSLTLVFLTSVSSRRRPLAKTGGYSGEHVSNDERNRREPHQCPQLARSFFDHPTPRDPVPAPGATSN